MRSRSLAALILAVVVLLDGLVPARTHAIPVFDAGNFAQNVVTAIESVDQTLTQVLQYQNQLLQYEELVRNGLAPAVYTWDRLVSIHNKLETLANALKNYRHWLRDLADYLSKFGDLDYYRSAHCYASDLSCPASEWARILGNSKDLEGLGSEARKKTLDRLMRSLESSEGELDEEAQNLRKLQRQSQDAKGQLQAIQVGNQLASAEVHQLMQMREIMVALYRAVAVLLLVEQTREAQWRAASERYRRPMAKDSPKVHWEWWPEGATW
jgi:P-type conjugative transfer protein TrbJ